MERFSYSRFGRAALDDGCQVRISVTSIDSEQKHVRYHVKVSNVSTGKSWEVLHRYSDFFQLRNDLLHYFENAPRKCPGCVNYEKVIRMFEFPKKHVFTSRSVVVLNYRKRALRAFLLLLANHTFTTAPRCPTCGGHAFQVVQDFLTADAVGLTSSPEEERWSVDQIRQSIDIKGFIEYHPVTGEKNVNSFGQFAKPKVVSMENEASLKQDAARAPDDGTDSIGSNSTNSNSSGSSSSGSKRGKKNSSPKTTQSPLDTAVAPASSPVMSPTASLSDNGVLSNEEETENKLKNQNSKKHRKRRSSKRQEIQQGSLRGSMASITEDVHTSDLSTPNHSDVVVTDVEAEEELDLAFMQKLDVNVA